MVRQLRNPQQKKFGYHQAELDLFETAELVENSSAIIRFVGTENPRYLRALHTLLIHPISREHLDRVVGCSNGPDLISNLRKLGLGQAGLLCVMALDVDRDGATIKRGIYHLTELGRDAVNNWLYIRAIRTAAR